MMTKETNFPALEMPSAGVHGGGTSNGRYYKIEVRTAYHSPTVLGEGRLAFVIDHCWRAIPIQRGGLPWAANIPIRSYDGEAADHGLVTYVAAEAHRWAFLAGLEAHSIGGAMCVETRLVEIELHREWRTKEIGVLSEQKETFRALPTTPRAAPTPLTADMQGTP